MEGKSRNTNVVGVILFILILGGLGVGSRGGSGDSFFGGALPGIGDSELEGGIVCKITGCNGELCVAQGTAIDSSCVWQPSYACYTSAITECVQVSDDECGWRPTKELQACLIGAGGNGEENGRVTNFSQCAAQGNPIQESQPRRCIHNGQTFVEKK